MKRTGFTLIEILISVGIIAMLATLTVVAVAPARKNARDTSRRVALAQIGRLLWGSSCLVPAGGAGDYDLKVIVDEYVAAHPQAAAYVGQVPKDPKTGSASATGYHYLYDAAGTCAVYANLEKVDTEVTLPSLTAPAAGGGTGTLKASAPGPNGTDLYYQVSR